MVYASPTARRRARRRSAALRRKPVTRLTRLPTAMTALLRAPRWSRRPDLRRRRGRLARRGWFSGSAEMNGGAVAGGTVGRRRARRWRCGRARRSSPASQGYVGVGHRPARHRP